MNIIELTENNAKRTVTAVGSFDGVHRAHAELIGKAVDAAGRINAAPAVWTFDDGDPKPGQPRLTLPGEREALFARLGVGRIFTSRFDEVRDLSPEEFCRDILIGKCRAGYVFCGYNFRFGKGAAGDAALLCELMRKYGAGAVVVDEIKLGGTPVSSTSIRSALKKGDIKLANDLLGRPFSVTLPVVHGRRLGTGMGYPTINQNYPPELSPLRFGVYACIAYAEGAPHPAVTNVGVKPTVGSDTVTVETHIFGCDADLYGRDITVEFIDFLRGERKFATLEELKAQIARDAAEARKRI